MVVAGITGILAGILSGGRLEAGVPVRTSKRTF
jgi:hypothetical protein